jgi:hypothetical protein
MADAVWIEFAAGTMDQQLYESTNAQVNPPGSPPDGLIFHSSGPSPDGGWRIIDVWDQRATFDRFLAEQVLPTITELVGAEAMQQGQPPTVTSWSLVNYELH